MKIKQSFILGIATVTFVGLAQANSNPCNVDCTNALIAQAIAANPTPKPAIGGFNSASWTAACPTGATGLSNGCLVNAANAAASPIGNLITLIFNAYNTSPTSVDNSVFIKKFSPGYAFTPTPTQMTFDGTGVVNTTRIICNPFYENGFLPDDALINDPTSVNSSYVINLESETFLGGSTGIWDILSTAPGGNIPALAVSVYGLCIGTSAVAGSNGGPASLVGLAIS